MTLPPLPAQPLVTVIIDTFHRPHYLKLAVECVLRQSYPHLDIVIVDNASTPETKVYLAALRDPRIRVVVFDKNQYSPEDPMKMVDTCYNEGLRQARGELVMHLPDDDLLADDYVARMVRLFQENPDCVTAAGLKTMINAEGLVIERGIRETNYRPRFMPGHILTLDYMVRGRMFAGSGHLFLIRRAALIEIGGYHRDFESLILFGIVPTGDTGFDQDAIFYSRRHAGQLSVIMHASRYSCTRYTEALLAERPIAARWRAIDPTAADQVISHLLRHVHASAVRYFLYSLCDLDLRQAAATLAVNWSRKGFWLSLPRELWENRSVLVRTLVASCGLKKVAKALLAGVRHDRAA